MEKIIRGFVFVFAWALPLFIVSMMVLIALPLMGILWIGSRKFWTKPLPIGKLGTKLERYVKFYSQEFDEQANANYKFFMKRIDQVFGVNAK